MLRLIGYLAVIVVLAIGFSWLADRPGDIVIDWQGYHIETNVFHATIGLALMLTVALAAWSLMRHIWESPAAVGQFFQRRRQTNGLDALSSGMIAIGAGDRDSAVRYATQARKALPNEPLTHLLRAQAAQLSGDKATSRRIFEAMLASPDTEQLGLRGLFLEAKREGEEEAAVQFAQRAVKLNPKLEWSITSLFDLQCKRGDWKGALESLAISKRNGLVEKSSADRRRAVLLTAQAQAAEESDPELALTLALEAHGLAGDLIPASAIAGRALASRSNTPRAARVLQKTWKTSPHPDLAVAYAYARLGDSPRDRLERVKKLAGTNPHSIESPIAVATAAIEAKDFDTARHALKPLLDGRLTQRVCTLMARVESEEHGNKGRVREWLARAVNAPRDPAWTADGVVSEAWAPVSPVSGALDAFQWRVPVESLDDSSKEILASKLEELVALGAPVAGGIAAANEGVGAEAKAEVISQDRGDVLDVEPVTRKPTVRERAEGEETAGAREVASSAASGLDDPDVAVVSGESEQTYSRRGGGRKKPVAAREEDTGEDRDTSFETGSDSSGTEIVDTDSQAAHSGGTSHAKPARRKGSRRSGSQPRNKAGDPSARVADAGSEKGREKRGGRDDRESADAGAKRGKKKPAKGSRKNEPKIFVSPHAPDDPGPKSSNEPSDRPPATDNPYRRVTS